MKRKRAEWKVRLRKSNYEQTKGQLVPQVIVTRKYTLDDVIGRIMAVGNCAVNREVLEYAASLLTRHIGDCLLEGASVSTPLGQLSPVVTGTWQAADRKDPEVRALNTATVRYSISPELRRLLDDPLLEAVGVGVQNALAIYSLKDVGSQTVNERLTPGRNIVVEGNRLLMNGDSPLRGLYVEEAGTGRAVAQVRPEDMTLCTRQRIVAMLPAQIAPGTYRLRVVSQCSTSPRPLKEPAEYVWPAELRVE